MIIHFIECLHGEREVLSWDQKIAMGEGLRVEKRKGLA